MEVLRCGTSNRSVSSTKMKAEPRHVREMQVDLLKRKLQQETLLRKCKERRITYLSGKGKASGEETDGEVEALREEVDVLREQLKVLPSETIDWMLKYKDEKAKVEEIEADAADAFEPSEKSEMEGRSSARFWTRGTTSDERWRT